MDKLRIRTELDNNYFSIAASDGSIVRFRINGNAELTAPLFPEMYDIKVTNDCPNRCAYCYQNSLPKGKHADYLNILAFFDALKVKPIQVAIGGGEPTVYPHFEILLFHLNSIGINVSYTTSGMNLSPSVLRFTSRYASGVALTLHRSLPWQNALFALKGTGVKVHVHILVDGPSAIEYALFNLDKYYEQIDKMVLLPYVEMGRARPIKYDIESLCLDPRLHSPKIDFGAGFHKTLVENGADVFDFEQEMFMRYVDFVDGRVYSSSVIESEGETIGEFLSSRT